MLSHLNVKKIQEGHVIRNCFFAGCSSRRSCPDLAAHQQWVSASLFACSCGMVLSLYIQLVFSDFQSSHLNRPSVSKPTLYCVLQQYSKL